MRALVGLLVLAACTPRIPQAPAATAAVAPAPGRLLLAHTNDLHSHFRPSPAPWLPGSPEIGGFAALDAHLGALRATHTEDAVLWLDGGDLLTGTPLMEYEVHGAWGGAMVDFLGAAGVDAWVLGNHELDRGWDNAAKLVAASPAPVLSANVRAADGVNPGFPGMKRHVVLEANGVRVGVFGLTTPGLHRLASADTMARLKVEDLAEVAAEEVAALEPEVDLVVALTHVGVESDRVLAQTVPGIDLIVGGHSHSSLVAPERIGETWVVQAGSYARQLGVLDLSVDGGRVTRLDGRLVDLLPDDLPGPVSPDTRALVDRWSDELDARFLAPAGEATARLDKSGGDDTPIGRWAADMVRSEAGTDIGLYNRGGLRADIAAGPLTVLDLYEVFPFRNELVTFEATGTQLVGMALRGLHMLQAKQYQPLEFSGLRITWREHLGAPELVSLEVGGAPVVADRVYTVATNSYVAEQWEHHLSFEPTNLRATGLVILEAAEASVRKGPVTPPPDPRVIRRR